MAQKFSFRTNVPTLESLQGHGDTAVVSPALTHSFSLYLSPGIPVEPKAAGWKCSQLGLLPSTLSWISVCGFCSSLQWKGDLHKLNYKPRELEVHLGLEEPLSWPRVVILVLCSSCWYNFPPFSRFQAQQRRESHRELIWAARGLSWPWPTQGTGDVESPACTQGHFNFVCCCECLLHVTCSSAS